MWSHNAAQKSSTVNFPPPLQGPRGRLLGYLGAFFGALGALLETLRVLVATIWVNIMSFSQFVCYFWFPWMPGTLRNTDFHAKAVICRGIAFFVLGPSGDHFWMSWA